MLALLRSGPHPSRNPRAEPRRPEGADRRQREGRAGAAQDGRRSSASTSCRPTCATCRTTPRNRCAASSRALKDGAFTLPLDNGAQIQVAIRVDARERSARDRLHRHLGAARQQLQRADGGVHGGGAVRVPHAGRRRHPAQRRLPEAAEGDHSRRLDAEPAAAGVGGRRQRRDLDLHHQRALRRARRDGGRPVHDEQLHLRQRRATSTTRRSPAAPARARISTAPASCRRT